MDRKANHGSEEGIGMPPRCEIDVTCMHMRSVVSAFIIRQGEVGILLILRPGGHWR